MSRKQRRLIRLAAPLAGALMALFAARPTTLRAQEAASEWLEECRRGSRDRAVHCEVRTTTLTGLRALVVDAGPNGGAQVRGWDGDGIRVEARVRVQAPSDARARELASRVSVETSGGRIGAEGPASASRESWSVSYDIRVPRTVDLDMRTTNGGLSLTDVAGTIVLRTANGGISLTNVGGNVRGESSNGGLRVRLSGTRWAGTGLDLRTSNGGISLALPADYDASLSVSTVNGGFRSELPVTRQTTSGRRFEAQLGAGGPAIRLSTTNGGIRIEKSEG